MRIPALIALLALCGCTVATGPEHQPVPDGPYSLVMVYGDDYESDDPAMELGAVDFYVTADNQIGGRWWLGDREGDDLGGLYDAETDSVYLTFTDNDTEHHLVGFVGPTGTFAAGHWIYWGADGSWGNGVFRLDPP